MEPREYDTPDLIGTIRSLEAMLERFRADPDWAEWCRKAEVEIEALTKEYERRLVH